ncbi:hypothetical protein D3C81_1697120 [compost metagenome]
MQVNSVHQHGNAVGGRADRDPLGGNANLPHIGVSQKLRIVKYPRVLVVEVLGVLKFIDLPGLELLPGQDEAIVYSLFHVGVSAQDKVK